MACAISLNYGISPPETCRVEVKPNRCAMGDKTFVQGNQQYTNAQGVTTRNYGMTVQDYNQGLRVPQMRTFLGPEYFNSGCTSLYCKDASMCPNSSIARSCDQTKEMLSSLFDSHSHFTGNDAPPACFGGKCSGYDSVVGWETKSGQPHVQWQAQADRGACGASY